MKQIWLVSSKIPFYESQDPEELTRCKTCLSDEVLIKPIRKPLILLFGASFMRKASVLLLSNSDALFTQSCQNLLPSFVTYQGTDVINLIICIYIFS